jgi:hypothetical protein
VIAVCAPPKGAFAAVDAKARSCYMGKAVRSSLGAGGFFVRSDEAAVNATGGESPRVKLLAVIVSPARCGWWRISSPMGAKSQQAKSKFRIADFDVISVAQCPISNMVIRTVEIR